MRCKLKTNLWRCSDLLLRQLTCLVHNPSFLLAIVAFGENKTLKHVVSTETNPLDELGIFGCKIDANWAAKERQRLPPAAARRAQIRLLIHNVSKHRLRCS